MAKMHLKISGVDFRSQGQSIHDYEHQTACGYVRKYVTRDKKIVECKHCLNVINKG